MAPPPAGSPRRRELPARAVGSISLPRALALALCFVASLLVSSTGVDLLLPEPAVPDVTAKMLWYGRHRDRIDTMVIGSSRVYRQIRPDVFDTAMHELGMESYSINMGAPSMRAPEMDYLLRTLLEPGRANPSRVFMAIESKSLTDLIEDRNEGTARVVYWHDLPATLFAIRQLWRFHEESSEELSVPKLCAQAVHHLRMWGLARLNVSDGVTAIRSALDPSETSRAAAAIGAMDCYRGFGPLRDEGVLHQRREELLRKRKPFERRVRRKRARYREAPPEEVDPDLVALLERFASRVRRVGAEPVFFVAPNPSSDSLWMQRIADRHLVDAVFVYDDPNRYPWLFDADHYFDMGHLDDEASRRLTRRLVADYVGWKRSRGDAPEVAAP